MTQDPVGEISSVLGLPENNFKWFHCKCAYKTCLLAQSLHNDVCIWLSKIQPSLTYPEEEIQVKDIKISFVFYIQKSEEIL